jgi:hypothetical protein
MTTQKPDKKPDNDSTSKRGSTSGDTEEQREVASKDNKSSRKNEEVAKPDSSKKSK